MAKVISVVYEPTTWPVWGIWVTGFVIEVGDRWLYRQSECRSWVPLPAVEPESITKYVLQIGIKPD
jgi:hypothetical protein